MDKEYERNLDKVIPQLQQLSLDGAAGATALANILSQKGLISFEDYKSLKAEIKDALVKELSK